MEKIQEFLEDDEEILWKYVKVKNLYFSYIAFSLILINPTYILWIYFLFLMENSIIKVILVLMAVSVIIIFLYIIFKIPNDKRKFIEKYNLSLDEFKRYQVVYILTNKRWIQKNYRYIKGASKNYILKEFIEIPRCIVQQNDDILFVNLESFHVIKIELKSRKLEFFISDDYYFLNSTVFKAKIFSKQDFQELIRIIKDNFPIKKEELHNKGEILYLQNQF